MRRRCIAHHVERRFHDKPKNDFTRNNNPVMPGGFARTHTDNAAPCTAIPPEQLSRSTSRNSVGCPLGSETRYDPSGKRVSARSYDRDSGQTTKQIEYASDGSRVVTTPNSDRTVTIQSYNAHKQITQKQTLSQDGELTEHYDPATGQVTNQVTTKPDGHRTAGSLYRNGNLGAQDEYDASGRRTSSVSYDPRGSTGTLTYVTYNRDGSRHVDKAEDERHIAYTVDSNGQVHDRHSMPLSQDDKEKLAQWKAGAEQT